MRDPGGTLTVTGLRRDGIMLSWAGGVTAQLATCPAQGQLLVAADDYRALAQIEVPGRPLVVR
jgi:hypothetical protein